jgi:hypothetical protein
MKVWLLLAGAVACGFLAWGGFGSEAGASEQLAYWRDGQPKLRAHLVEGQRHGEFTSWHENGQVEARGRYEQGQRTGAWQYWHADGSPDQARSGSYAGGVRVADPLTAAR